LSTRNRCIVIYNKVIFININTTLIFQYREDNIFKSWGILFQYFEARTLKAIIFRYIYVLCNRQKCSHKNIRRHIPRLWLRSCDCAIAVTLRLRVYQYVTRCLKASFYRAMLSVSAVFAVARCPSVRPSRWCIVSRGRLLSGPGSPIILDFLSTSADTQFHRNAVSGAQNTRGWENWRSSTEISVYLENGTRYAHDHRWRTDTCRFRWHWVTLTGVLNSLSSGKKMRKKIKLIRPSVCHLLVLYPDGWRYRQTSFSAR